jgi:hypothetical protein
MPRAYLVRRFDRVLGAIAHAGGGRPRRERTGRFLAVESLESRALLTNIIASGVITSSPVSGGYNYTIALSNSSQSDSPIGTFWFAWSPGQDYLPSDPISLSAPTGWVAQVTHGGTGDGYGIEFVADTPSDDIQPGSSLSFSFTSASTPASIQGSSPFYSGLPVGTSAVYPGAAINDGGFSFVVAARVTLASIAVMPASSSVPSGETDQFNAVGTYSDNSTHDLTSQASWASSATSVATISGASGSQGLATGVGQGTATISATVGGVTGSTTLTVGSAVLKSLTVNPANPMVEIGNSEQFSATGTFSDNTTQDLTTFVNWASGTASVASVSNTSGSQGLATGVTKGSSNIEATLDGITGSTVLSVTPLLQSIEISPANPSVPKGVNQQFTATGVYSDHSTANLTNEVTWASANAATSAISNAPGSIGVARALAVGTSSISATFEGVTGTTTLNVSPAVLQSIWISPASPSTLEGTTDQLTASGTYSDGSTQNLTSLVSWTSGSPSVATVSPKGLASGITPGASSITASYQGVTGKYSLAVTPPPVTLTGVDPIIKRQKVTAIVLNFSSGLDPSLAVDRGLYRLVSAGRGGSFTARDAKVIKVRNAGYLAASAPVTVTLVPSAPFSARKPVKLTIKGLPPSGLEDSEGRLIDGDGNGQPGGDAVIVLDGIAPSVVLHS